jgi:hypothetical protein
MIFILVQIRDERFAPEFVKWRATCASADKTVDVWLFANDIDQAKLKIRRTYPDARFSDELVH